MFEEALERSFANSNKEKTFIDKLLAKDDINAIREIVKKPTLNRSDLLQILYLLSSSESKLLNYGEWDRYVIMKYFIWIREHVKVAELIFDYEESLKKRKVPISPKSERLFERVKVLFDHNIKFLIDLYFQIGRTSLSIGATGFLETLKNKYEVNYQQAQNTLSTGVAKGGIMK